ncbi:MAG: phenylalanine--tRNA ligase subunit alpha, partial [Planctomycetales bacterium]|nr:phenylalanine--tRNA ligase subunit alpha [Planctomycetales bacterium]
MDLEAFQTSLEALATAAEQAFSAANDSDAFEAARVKFLGARSGEMKSLQKQLGTLSKEDKPAGGKKLNEAKQRIEAAVSAASERLAGSTSSTHRGGPLLDPTLPGTRHHLGRIHPITQTIEHLKEI